MSSAATTAIKYERLKELETALQLKNKEIEDLTRRRDDLMSRSNGDDENDQNTKTNFERLTDKFLRKDYIQTIPAEHVGNAMRQMEAATKTYRRETEILQKSIHDLNIENDHHTSEQHRLDEQIDMMVQLTGLPVPRTPNNNNVVEWDFGRNSKKPVTAHTQNLQERAKAAERAAMEADAVLADGEGYDSDGGAGSAADKINRTKQRSFDELKRTTHVIQKEIRTADVIRQKKSQAIKEMTKTLETKKRLNNELGEQYNAYRVLDREVRQQKLILEELMQQHAETDLVIEGHREGRDDTCLAILERDCKDLTTLMESQVEKRRMQDRALKAQEYRQNVLEKRLATVRKSLQDLRLDGVVNNIMADYFQLESERATNSRSESAAAMGGGSSLTVTAAPAGDAEQHAEDGQQAVAAPATMAPMELPSEEELLNVDAIIPVDEHVHPAIYSLFHSEKQKKERAVATQRIMLREKDDAIEALTSKVIDLTNDYDVALQNLEEVQSNIMEEEEEYKSKIRAEFDDQRRRYNEAIEDKLRVRKQQHRFAAQEKKDREEQNKFRPATFRTTNHTAASNDNDDLDEFGDDYAASPSPARRKNGDNSTFCEDDDDGIDDNITEEELQVIVDEANRALCCLNKAALSELKVFRAPPTAVRVTGEAVCILMGRKTNWESIKAFLGDSKVLEAIKCYDKDNISPNRIAKLQPYIESKQFTPEVIKRSSTAAAQLCQWCIAMYNYSKVSTALKRRRAREQRRKQQEEPVAAPAPEEEKLPEEPAKKEDNYDDLTDEELQAILDEAANAMNCIDKASITEIKRLRSPPAAVVTALEAVSILMGRKSDWESIKLFLNDTKMLEAIKCFDKDNVSSDRLELLKPYIESDKFTPEHTKRASVAAAQLCVWSRAIYKYSTALAYRRAHPAAAPATTTTIPEATEVPAPPTEALDGVVLSGPSGVGKGTLIKKLQEEFPGKFGFSVSHTTRAPRDGEVDGKDYHFTTREKMQAEVDAGEFIEYADVHGNMYGTSKAALQAVRESGATCIIEIDVQGVTKLKAQEHGLNLRYIFITAPTIEELEDRITKRGKETPEKIQTRLETARKECEFVSANPATYDMVLKNDDLEKAYGELKAAFVFVQSSDERTQDENVPAEDQSEQDEAVAVCVKLSSISFCKGFVSCLEKSEDGGALSAAEFIADVRTTASSTTAEPLWVSETAAVPVEHLQDNEVDDASPSLTVEVVGHTAAGHGWSQTVTSSAEVESVTIHVTLAHKDGSEERNIVVGSGFMKIPQNPSLLSDEGVDVELVRVPTPEDGSDDTVVGRARVLWSHQEQSQ